jgi:hypothetical protein
MGRKNEISSVSSGLVERVRFLPGLVNWWWQAAAVKCRLQRAKLEAVQRKASVGWQATFNKNYWIQN